MAERIFAAVLLVAFACFLYIAASDILHLVDLRQFGGVFMLLFCVIVCVGWIGFLAALALAGQAGTTPSLRGYRQWRAAIE
jgi:hypothetical protein